MGLSHSLRYAVNCSTLFTELPLLQRAAAARAAGFDAVEFWWPFDAPVPRDAAVDAFAASVRDAGVALVGLNAYGGDQPGGDRGIASWPGRSAEFADSLDVTVGLGERLGCRAFNVLFGNRVDGASAEEQDELGAANLALASSVVARRGGVVLLEALSGAARYPLRRSADVVAVIERVEAEHGATRVRVLADLYHWAVNGDDLAAAVGATAGRVGHVQVADAPGRHEPGSGRLPLDDLLVQLEAGGYAGWAALEHSPTTTTAESLAWLPRARRGAGG